MLESGMAKRHVANAMRDSVVTSPLDMAPDLPAPLSRRRLRLPPASASARTQPALTRELSSAAVSRHPRRSKARRGRRARAHQSRHGFGGRHACPPRQLRRARTMRAAPRTRPTRRPRANSPSGTGARPPRWTPSLADGGLRACWAPRAPRCAAHERCRYGRSGRRGRGCGCERRRGMRGGRA